MLVEFPIFDAIKTKSLGLAMSEQSTLKLPETNSVTFLFRLFFFDAFPEGTVKDDKNLLTIYLLVMYEKYSFTNEYSIHKESELSNELTDWTWNASPKVTH